MTIEERFWAQVDRKSGDMRWCSICQAEKSRKMVEAHWGKEKA